ncbi:hypothetical protein [Caldimonas brevitalea]|uniref:Uncharacterized protein n=1 Tax=Caldimonas brevitalea TaxID=413882 RepID=A0A0G3BFE0_9BURK|nr:hypothetical protein [Caldimonas brevitalea]AKJ28169.1 hypothetical protein AAW51_1478 [Caldimonas brevitalea]
MSIPRTDPRDITDVVPRPPAIGPRHNGAFDPLGQWLSLCDAYTRTTFDSAEQVSAAWAEMQALWLSPLQWWMPSAGRWMPNAAEAVRDQDASKLVAGTMPPQPLQEATRELMTVGLHSLGDWRRWWGPWAAWPGVVPNDSRAS